MSRDPTNPPPWRPMPDAGNDNCPVDVRVLRLPMVGLPHPRGGGSDLAGDAAAIVKGGGVDHGCRLTLRPVPASSGKFYNSTGGRA